MALLSKPCPEGWVDDDQYPTNRRTFLGAALLAAMSLSARAATMARNSSQHIVLLGDSVFDNGAYVSGGPDVAQQLRERLPPGGRVTRAATEGAVTSEVRLQLQRVQISAGDCKFVSFGGNPPLGNVTEHSVGCRFR